MSRGSPQNVRRYTQSIDTYSEYSEEDPERDIVTVDASFEYEPSEYSEDDLPSDISLKGKSRRFSYNPNEYSEERICNNLTCNAQRPIEYVPSRKNSRNLSYVKGDSLQNQPSQVYVWDESKSTNKKSIGDSCSKPCVCKNASTNVTSLPNQIDSDFPFYNPNALFTVLVNKGTILINPKSEIPFVSVTTSVQRSLPNLSVRQAKVQCKSKFVDETNSIQQKESLENTVFFSASSASISEPESKELCGKNCETNCGKTCMCKNLFDGVMALFTGDKRNMVTSKGTSMGNKDEDKAQKILEPKVRRRKAGDSDNQCMKSRFKACRKQKHFTQPVCDSSVINPQVNMPIRNVLNITSSTTVHSKTSFSDSSKRSITSSVRSNTTSVKTISSDSVIFNKSQYKQLRVLKKELDRIKEKSGLYSKSSDGSSTFQKVVRPSSEERSCGGEESEVCRCLKSSRSCRKSSTNATFGGYLASQFIGSNPNDSVEPSSDQNYVFQSSNYRKNSRLTKSAQHTARSSQKEIKTASYRSQNQNNIGHEDLTDSISYTSHDGPKFRDRSSRKSFRRDRSVDSSKKLKIPAKTGSSTVITPIKKEEQIHGMYSTKEIFRKTTYSKPAATEESNHEIQDDSYKYKNYENFNPKRSTVPKCSNMVQICKEHSVDQTFGYDPPDSEAKRKESRYTSNGLGCQKVLRYLESIHGQESNQISKQSLGKHRSRNNGFGRRSTEEGDVLNGRHRFPSERRMHVELNEAILKRRFVEGYPMVDSLRNASINKERLERIELPQLTMERCYNKSILKRKPFEEPRIPTPRRPMEPSKRLSTTPYMLSHKTHRPYFTNYIGNTQYPPDKWYNNPSPRYCKVPMNRKPCPSYTESGYNSIGEKSYSTPSKSYSEHSSEQNGYASLYDNLGGTYRQEEYSEVTDEDSYPEN